MSLRSLTILLVTGLLLPGVIAPAAASPQDPPLSREELKWLDRLPREDGEAVRRSLGWAAPEFPDSARWQGEPGPDLEALRGKVVLVQTFTTRGAGRSAAGRLARSIEPLAEEDDFVAIAVHTPEHLDQIDELLPRLELDVPVLVDEKGEWCDAVGAFRRPVTYLIDRQGNVRYASVSARSVEEAARKLLSETADPDTPPRTRESAAPDPDDAVSFPTFSDSVGSSTDQRGNRAPDFFVEKMWKEPVADASGKVVVLDFWATWCGPCVKAIPHMNDIQNHYGSDVVCLGISDENNFEAEMRRRNLHERDFDYGLAVDRTGTLKNFFGVRGIPHVAVLSGDWVVRWQGHPTRLTKEVMDSIVEPNRKLMSSAAAQGTNAPPPSRWVDWLIKNSK